ncbi:MAG: hypothetical protein R3B91_14365 [Planctomycetaceae bacterium]
MLATSVLATCLVRPAYLSLSSSCRFLGVLLLIRRRDGRLTGKQLSWSGGILSLRLCSAADVLRFAVGQFGLVAFGGANLIGIAGQFEPRWSSTAG